MKVIKQPTMLGQRMILRNTYRLTVPKLVILPICRTNYSTSSSSNNPFPLNDKERKQAKKQSQLPWYKRWTNYSNSEQFQNKTMPKVYICAFVVSLVPMYFYMRDRYHEDKQLKHINAKYAQDPSSLSEYEYLVLKSMNHLEKLRPLELKKYKIYQLMRKEFRRKNLFNQEMFNPTPQELNDWYQNQVKYELASKVVPILVDKIDSKDKINANPAIQNAEDTTAFYDSKAKEYDDAVKWEERGIFMGSKRKWLMSQAKGDVLEVSCGTGRNIPYLYLQQIKSLTFIDSARNMVEVTKEKFKKTFPEFKKVAFAVGKAEDLSNIAQDVKYDTIVEAFGLCCHEDPVKALQNMAKLLKPGGRIVLLEHGRSNWGFINNHLDFRSEKRMETWKCRWNLDIGELIDEAGLDITKEKRAHFSTTWMVVVKKPEDPINPDEKPFLDKLFGRESRKVQKS